MQYKQYLLRLVASMMLLLVVACGGSGGGSGNDSRRVSGVLVQPETAAVTTTRALQRDDWQGVARAATTAVCHDVPSGYEPLAAVEIEFVDADGRTRATATTDDCGRFAAAVPADVARARAVPAAYRPIDVDIEVFAAQTPKLVSVVPMEATFQIASIQRIAPDKLAVTVTDSVTNKAVIGIPGMAFGGTVNGRALPIAKVESAANTPEAASVVLVMDASGSMGHSVTDEYGDLLVDGNGRAYNRMRIAARAAHLYLDGVSPYDETAIVVFDDAVSLIDDQMIEREFQLLNANGDVVPYRFSASGFAADPRDLRFVVDSYNYFSALWPGDSPDPRHPDTPALTHANFYPWAGGTALYDALDQALRVIRARSSTRKIIVAMSDGNDNSSLVSAEQVVREAAGNGIPIYTVAYHLSGSGAAAMEEMAQRTNASFFEVRDADLSAAFQGIQSGITFQYIVTLDRGVASGDAVDLSIRHAGVEVSRQVVLP